MTRSRAFSLALCLALNACEDESASVPVDETWCEERDRAGDFCDPNKELIDSTGAVALLREEYPGAQIYSMRSGGGGTVTVDGEDDQWDFMLQVPDGTWHSVGVTGSGEIDGEEIDDRECDGTPFEALDSRRAVHEAIAAFDSKVGFYERGNLFLRQNVCGHEELPETHYVLIYPRLADTYVGDYYARFRHDGTFIDLVGPCDGTSLIECLAGVVVEPEE